MSIREVKCDHAIEHPKLHPVMHYVNIGNLIIDMCGTCYNALKGQIYEGEISDNLKATAKGLKMTRKILRNEEYKNG